MHSLAVLARSARAVPHTRRERVRVLGAAEGVDRMPKVAPARSGSVVRWSRDDGWQGLDRLVLSMCRVKLSPAAPYN